MAAEVIPMSPSRGEASARRRYLRPLYLGIGAAALGELFLFVVWGIFLFPQGDLVKKFVWIMTCSLGMGAALGALVDLLVVDRLDGLKAMIATTGMAILVIGVGCNYLCWSIDQQLNWWGGASDPGLFLGSGIFGTVLLGWLVSYFLFSIKGSMLLDRLGL